MASFPVFLSHSNKIGRRVSPDTHRPILYHVMCFVQRARAKIKRWPVINIYVAAKDSLSRQKFLSQPVRSTSCLDLIPRRFKIMSWNATLTYAFRSISRMFCVTSSAHASVRCSSSVDTDLLTASII